MQRCEVGGVDKTLGALSDSAKIGDCGKRGKKRDLPKGPEGKKGGKLGNEVNKGENLAAL